MILIPPNSGELKLRAYLKEKINKKALLITRNICLQMWYQSN